MEQIQFDGSAEDQPTTVRFPDSIRLGAIDAYLKIGELEMKVMRLCFITMFTCVFASTAMAGSPTFYVITYKADANSIVGYKKHDTDGYRSIGEFRTGGRGTRDLEIPALEKDDSHPLANGDDPLISANSLVLTAERRHLIAVNPGDATISLMAIADDGSLSPSGTAPASDKFPVSVASFGSLVVAASVGENNSAGSISAFRIQDGKLEEVSGSRRDLQARPSTIAFSSDGEHVIVDELVTGKIKVYAVSDGTLSMEPVSVIDSPRASDSRFQAIPVGFAVHGNGGDDVILVSEARFLTPDFKLRAGNGEVVQSPLYSWQTSSLSTYALSDDGQLSVLSADVLTGAAVESGKIANCWVVLSKDGRHLYAANALSSSISRFRIDPQGHAILEDSTAYKDESETLFFSDIAISREGTELYQLVGNKGQVLVFAIKADGDLQLKQTLDGLPELGTYGLAVN